MAKAFVIKDSLVYLFSSLVNKAVPFLLLPLLTSYLPPAEFGLIAIFQVSLTAFQAFYGGLNVNVARTYFNRSNEEFREVMGAVFLALTIIFSVLTSGILLYLLFDGATFGVPAYWFGALPILSALGVANLINLTLLRTEGESWKYLRWEVGHALANLSLTLILFVGVESSGESRLWGISVPLALYGGFSVFSLRRRGFLDRFARRDYLKEVVGISLPLIPHALASIVIAVSDRIFISHYLGNAAVGIYTVGYQFGMVVMVITDAFIKAWQPWFFREMAKPGIEAARGIVRATYLYLVLLILGALAYSKVAEWVIDFAIDSAYRDSIGLVLPIAMSYVAFGLYQIFMPYLVYIGKTQVLMVTTSLAAGTNIILNILWISVYGMNGAVYATLVAYTFSALLVIVVSQRYCPMPWRFGGSTVGRAPSKG
ncbi:lipopolysaccharide biosynthesis protein [Methylohalobius crimeensis]|uniref:lipopolysaccharide biosynthesis protein n=1 Tax=Methylohalobius crimeensis TaxID=244365 RepID=UPI0013791025|nr:oligosaccharide flippase family protein [Methylohalobius crimeensis]